MSLQFNAFNAFLCMECMYFNFEVRPIAELLIYMYVLQMTRIQSGKKIDGQSLQIYINHITINPC